MGSIPVDLDRGNKTFSLRRAPTQYPMLHVNLCIIAHTEFSSPAFAFSPRRREMKTYFSICNILVIYMPINLAVLFSSLKVKRE